MSKRIFIVHGWEGSPTNGWFPWLKRELEQKGFEVYIPQLPDPKMPLIEKWIPALAQAIGTPDEKTYLIGHSMGCQTIARYLELLPDGVMVGGAIFVAGFFKRLTGIEEDTNGEKVAKHWLITPLDLKKSASHLLKSIAIFSDNDPYVPLDNQDDFSHKLGSEIIIQKNMKHFSGDTGIRELPIVLESLMKISE